MCLLEGWSSGRNWAASMNRMDDAIENNVHKLGETLSADVRENKFKNKLWPVFQWILRSQDLINLNYHHEIERTILLPSLLKQQAKLAKPRYG